MSKNPGYATGHVRDLNARLQSKERKIDKLRQDKTNIINSHENLEKALTDEVELAERRELERKHILPIPQQMPSYWGPNAFSESYREIQISIESPEFHIINDLLNSTITTHDNQYGTIYGKDPTEFIVTQIKRIQNAKLWHEYCFNKVR
jgi:predicted transcriptional regulator